MSNDVNERKKNIDESFQKSFDQRKTIFLQQKNFSNNLNDKTNEIYKKINSEYDLKVSASGKLYKNTLEELSSKIQNDIAILSVCYKKLIDI